LGAEDWDRLPDRFGFEPAREAEWRDLPTALRRALDNELTARQREVFVVIVLNGVPLDTLIIKLGSNRNAMYKCCSTPGASCGPLLSRTATWATTLRSADERLAGAG
jgi:hypothetical protein